ncbi:nucleotide sugar dehydrogenase [Alphaproteobacteria bacterium]|nr:nucleotide sugar dehydrogenase [Alphaproteobacteria bacterium]
MDLKKTKIGIVGLGYVGLPLAIEFSGLFEAVGFDVEKKRVDELLNKFDSTLEVSADALSSATALKITNNSDDLKDVNVYIITVPTPVDKYNHPDLSYIAEACKTVGNLLSVGNIVIFESTVYPGATEEYCVPILEKHSQLRFNTDFYCGYSPERVNPGDKEHTLTSIKKITSGSNESTAQFVNQLYGKIIIAGTHLAPSIKVAEAAKVIENTQRDLNIAFVNELSIIFDIMEIDTEEVLKAARTKWNFLNFTPGLVGGHCIGVDPYYLTSKAKELGYNPSLILAGRHLNDNMGKYVAVKLVKGLIQKDIPVESAKVLIMGLTFKENCPDCRNSGVFRLISELVDFGCAIDVTDPYVCDEQKADNFRIKTKNSLPKNFYDAVIICVKHKEFYEYDVSKIKSFCKKNYIIYDLKNVLNTSDSDMRL